MSTFIIEQWIGGYSNCGTKIKTAAIKNELNRLNKTCQTKYELVRCDGLWFIAKEVA